MKNLTIILILLISILNNCFSQNFIDVIYLKNNTKIKGLIMEQIPNETLKIMSEDDKLIELNISEIANIVKELDNTYKPDLNIQIKNKMFGYNKFYIKDMKLRYNDLKFVVKYNKEAYKYSQKANWNYGISYIFGGISMLFIGMVIDDIIYYSKNEAPEGFQYVDASFFIALSIPTASCILLSKRANNQGKKAASIYNNDLNSQSLYQNPIDIKMGITQNGIGLVMKF